MNSQAKVAKAMRLLEKNGIDEDKMSVVVKGISPWDSFLEVEEFATRAERAAAKAQMHAVCTHWDQWWLHAESIEPGAELGDSVADYHGEGCAIDYFEDVRHTRLGAINSREVQLWLRRVAYWDNGQHGPRGYEASAKEEIQAWFWVIYQGRIAAFREWKCKAPSIEDWLNQIQKVTPPEATDEIIAPPPPPLSNRTPKKAKPSERTNAGVGPKEKPSPQRKFIERIVKNRVRWTLRRLKFAVSKAAKERIWLRDSSKQEELVRIWFTDSLNVLEIGPVAAWGEILIRENHRIQHASDEELTKWLTKKLGKPIRIPNP